MSLLPASFRRTHLLGLTAIILPVFAAAQTTPSATTDREKPVELSPFVVTTENDTGYLAATTLSGTRLRTNLEDVGASISIVTKDLLNDLAANNLRDILVYTTGTEVTGLGGNLSGSSLNNEQFDEAGLSNNPGTRVRGLASADITRGYFKTDIPFDSYNTSRLEINRGANAIMFGVGSPAGIINSTPDMALLGKTRGEAELGFDNFGSRRFSFGFNAPLAKNLAIKVAAVTDDKEFKQKPAYNDQDRLYGAVTWRPTLFKSSPVLGTTTFRANAESGRIRANNPRSLPPQDRITMWFQPDALLTSLGVTPKLTWDASKATGQPGVLAVAQNLNRSPVVVFPDYNTNAASDAVSTLGLVQNVVGRAFVSSNFAGTAGTSAVAQNAIARLPTALRNRGYADSVFYVTPTLKDTSIFDFRNKLIDGPNKEENTDFYAYNLSLEQLFFQNQAGIELAFDKQGDEDYGWSLIPRGQSYITIDVNTKMWDGTPNPNFGKPYTATDGNTYYSKTDRETFRSTAFYQLDTKKYLSDFWGRMLGRHVITGLYQNETTLDDQRTGVPYVVLGNFPYATSQDRTSNVGKLVTTINYLGSSIAGNDSASGANIANITANRLDIPAIVQGGSFLLRQQTKGSPIQYVGGLNIIKDDKYLSNGAKSGVKSKRRIESLGVSLQSYLVDELLIGTVGWRRESVDTASARALPNGVEGNFLVSDPSYTLDGVAPQEFTDDVFSRGLVAKVPDAWVKKLPFINKINFHYSDSENFSPPQGRRFDPFGTSLTPPAGKTTDYGFSVALPSNKAVLKVTWYKTIQSNVNNPTLTTAIAGVMNIHQLAFQSVLQGYAKDSDGDKFPDGYIPPPQSFLDLYQTKVTGNTLTFSDPGVVGTSDYVAKGVEMELFLNPTPSWTVAFNAAKQESVRSNSGGALADFFATPVAGGQGFLTTWLKSDVPLFAGATPSTGGTVGDYAQRYLKTPFDLVKLQDGAPAQELRKWRWNIVSNYRFRQGWIKGFGFGGAVRWQDKVAIGYPITTDSAGNKLFDVGHPFYGPVEVNYDAWVSYKRKIIKGVNWQIQFNVRNLLNNRDLIPVQTQPTGEVAVYRIPQPMTFTLTNRFEF